MTRGILVWPALLGLFALSGCSSTPDEIDYQNSDVTPTLEMPPDIIRRESKRNLELPGSSIGTTANTGRAVLMESSTMATTAAVVNRLNLPAAGEIRIEGHGDSHWLSVPGSAEDVFPLVREFWIAEGFELQDDEPLMGVLRTRWMGSRAGSDSFFSRILASMRAAESKHQYITRVERGEDLRRSLVFIAHRHQELMLQREDEGQSAEASVEGWQFTAADPSRETEMLSRLMLFLGMQDDAAQTELERIGGFAPRAQLVPGNAEEEEAPYLLVKQTFERTWNRLRHNLMRYDVLYEDGGRETDSGALIMDAEGFSRGLTVAGLDDRNNLKLILEGQANMDATRIEVLDNQGSVDRSDTATRVLQSLESVLK